MKLRNKRLVTALVAAFAVVFMAGSAFAFVSNGALVFTGTANIDAHLQLTITEANVTDGDWTVDARVDDHTDRAVNFSADFFAPNQRAAWAFVVENTGTMPALITDAPIEAIENFIYGGQNFDMSNQEVRFAWGQSAPIQDWNEVPTPQVVPVGESITLFVAVDFMPHGPSDFAGHVLYGAVTNTLSLSYVYAAQ